MRQRCTELPHTRAAFGAAGVGGLKYYILDNEYSLWHSTHRDVWPTGATMEQVRDSMIAYSGAIKNVDPGALVVGPDNAVGTSTYSNDAAIRVR